MTEELRMVAIRNICPRGALDVPLLRRVVDAGEVVDVDEAHAERLLEQSDNWQAVNAAPVPRPKRRRAPKPVTASASAAADTEGDLA